MDTMSSLRVLAVAMLGTVVAGCGAAEDDKAGRSDAVGVSEELLTNWQGYTFFTANNYSAPVCFRGDGSAVNRATVRNAIEKSWGAVTRINFSGWGECPTSVPSTTIPVYLSVSNSNPQAWEAYGYPGVGGRLTGVPGPAQIFIRLHSSDINALPWIAVHEMGHALGFAHEHTRSSTPSACIQEQHGADCATDADCLTDDDEVCDPHASSGNPLKPWRCAIPDVVMDYSLPFLTRYDAESVMNYCRTNQAAPLTFWDIYGAQLIYGRRIDAIRPLISSYSPWRGDHFAGFSAPTSFDYAPVYGEGWIYTVSAPGTVPLDLYWHAGRGDNMVVATQSSRQAAQGAGYTFAGTVGYVYPTQQPGTVPFKLYWSAAREDNFTTASAAGAQAAAAAGYSFVRDEAFIFADIPYDMLTYYYSSARTERLHTRTGSATAAAADLAGYTNYGFDGFTLRHNVQGTTAFRQFWSNDRQEHYLTGTAWGAQNASSSGYSEIGNEGFVFDTQVTGTSPFRSFWSSGNLDNVTSRAYDFFWDGYTSLGNEGYMYSWF